MCLCSAPLYPILKDSNGVYSLAHIHCFLLLLSPQALTKFLKCVNWDLPQEAKQALELLGKWRPMDVEDSLELLSSQFTNPTVRRYAVARLQQADDEVGVGGRRRGQEECLFV